MKKVIGLVIGLLPVSASAECVPVPDCASIGYTETSCDGDSVKCPFDTSKLKCFPCDSSFRFSCDGENTTAAVGAACNNKYAACECVAGANFINGKCICDTSCKVGNIYYSDGTCSSCHVAGKTAVGVVVKDNELIMALNIQKVPWSRQNIDINTLDNIHPVDNALMDYNGKQNTKIIVDYYGQDADITNLAALYCYDLAPNGMESSKNQWYLPALGELYNYISKNYNAIYNTYNILGLSISNLRYWSSTESDAFRAWIVYMRDGIIENNVYFTKIDNYLTACLLKL